MASLSNAMACEDVRSLIEFADQDAAARDGKIGLCRLLHEWPVCLRCPPPHSLTASLPAPPFHGVYLYSDRADSPHLDADKIKAEMYFGCAETDEYAPKEMVDNLESYLANTAINSRIEWYPGHRTWFCVSPNAKANTTKNRQRDTGKDYLRCIVVACDKNNESRNAKRRLTQPIGRSVSVFI